MPEAAELRALLQGLVDGRLEIEAVFERLSHSSPVADFANLDLHRSGRTGMPEVIFCQGKTTGQVVQIVGRLYEAEGRMLATRASPETATAVLQAFPAAQYHPLSRVIVLQPTPPVTGCEADCYAAVVTAGTSDLGVAEEAALTLEYLGWPVRRVTDVGVAGIHRLMSRLDVLREASAVIAVAGMEGALASVVGGLVSCPVVAVPTSVGYGASFGGVAALLAMLNSCSPGVTVVNIDNGFGAAVHVHQVLRLAARHQKRASS